MALQGLTLGWDRAQLPQGMGGGDSGDNRALSVPLETPTDKTNSTVIQCWQMVPLSVTSEASNHCLLPLISCSTGGIHLFCPVRNQGEVLTFPFFLYTEDAGLDRLLIWSK